LSDEEQAPAGRSFWSGTISIGLVNVPVKLYTMIRDKSYSFHFLRKKDGCPLRYQRVCTYDNEVVEWSDVARGYEKAGAAAISVLTDEPFFGGRMSHLEEVRGATTLPVLRKDFVLDPWQVWEARAAGADAVLLIVAALTDAELGSLLGVAREAGLDTLVEVHDRSELDRALAAGSRIVGVNNRDLKTLTVSLQTALSLATAIPDDVVAVAESGIRSSADLVRLREAGFDAFLVGERLMSAPDPGEALKRLLEEAS
jgi:indole-3-glycerol phosphate synthase